MKLYDGKGSKNIPFSHSQEIEDREQMMDCYQFGTVPAIANELMIEAQNIRDGRPCDDATLLDVAAAALTMGLAMTPLEFKAARLALGLNQRQMAEALRVGGEAVIRSWESGRRPISGPASVAVELMLKHGCDSDTRPKDGDAKQGSTRE